MGVYIPNMEMPTSCLECRLYNDPWCMAKNRNQWRTAYNRPPKGERQNDCPLVPVPPHGRLGDLDALITTFCEWGTILENKGKFVITMAEAKQTIVDIIEDAPTIIQEEKGE